MSRHPHNLHISIAVKHGFTLLEIAIVLVIIGLLAGGVFMARSLIREADIRAMLGEYDHYLKAIQEFQDKYQALPGDMSVATGFWGAKVLGCTVPAATTAIATTPATCNGNGDGRIGNSGVDGVPTVGTTHEWWLAWQHLANAGLIDGRFSGAPITANSNEAVPGTNVPASKISSGGWTLYYYLNTVTDVGDPLWGDQYGHMLSFGNRITSDYTRGAVLTPNEALAIDLKLDDGKPGTGKIRAWRTSVQANCTATDTGQTAATYNGGYAQPACSLLFILGM